MKSRSNDFGGNIYITGFMASGKSRLGAKIAEKLSMNFLDLDDVITEREGKSIKEIFNTKGEEYFRKKEKEYLLDLCNSYNGILSLGGGALQNQQIVEELKSTGILLFVNTPLKECVERVYRSSKRPILFDENSKIKSKQALFDELKTLYSQREKFYKQAQVSIQSQEYSTFEQKVEAATDKLKKYV